MQIGTYMGFAITACVLTVFMFITYCIALVDYSHISSCKSYHYSYFKVYCYSASKRHMAAVGTGLGSCLLICAVVQFMLSLTASIYCCGAVCCNTPGGVVRIISRHFVFMNLHGRIFCQICMYHSLTMNPLTPMSDQDRISPYNINVVSSRQAMRIRKKGSIKGLFLIQYQISKSNIMRIV